VQVQPSLRQRFCGRFCQALKKFPDRGQRRSQPADRAPFALQRGQLVGQPGGDARVAAQVARSLAPLVAEPQRVVASSVPAVFGSDKALAPDRLPLAGREL